MDVSATTFRKIDEIPFQFRGIFSEYPCFNIVQSRVLDSILYSDKSLVVSAPTGSGKTVVFELAIVKLLHSLENLQDIHNNGFKIVYISPIKSLCQERLEDWHRKFSPFGLNVISITGDSDRMDFSNLGYRNLIISTPEKWDCLTRKWRENERIVKEVKLFMIDEVHLLNEDCRGSTLEVIVNRMKIVENSLSRSGDDQRIRFMAVSATIPNVEDIAEWMGNPSNVEYFRFSEEVRPVKLNKIVIGYNYNIRTMTPFKFDLTLNYKLQFLMMQHAEGKPTLIFCSTRKSVEMTAKHLVQTVRIQLSPAQSQKLCDVANMITDIKTKDSIKHGIGYHHAGLVPETRHIIEDVFRKGDLPVLVTTSTLAMGVNLPAHLVIIKSTKCYDKCGFRDYSETAMHQMIGRAGRPQFDTNATVLILTSKDDQAKFEKMIGCSEPIESNLHRHLTEHLNAEVVLGTITDLEVAMHWLTSTFLYVRAMKNPRHYGLSVALSKTQIEQKLLEICQIDLNKLVTAGMITMDHNIVIAPTDIGTIMARYYVAFETMKLFTQITGNEILMQILALVSKCQEFSDIHLRVNDKKPLNSINKPSNKNRIRFPLNGKIKSGDMKVNCIIQAVLGNLDIPESSILNDSFTIMRSGERITKCLIEYLGSRRTNCYAALLNTIILGKCFHAKLWEDSPFLTKQLSGIGSVLSNHLASAGKTNFESILATNPRNIEMIIKKKPPFGDYLIEEVQHIPRYKMTLENTLQGESMQFKLIIELMNFEDIRESSTVNLKSVMTLLVGTNLNRIIIHEKYQHSYLIENCRIIRNFEVDLCTDLESIKADLISEDWVGIDCRSEMVLEPPKKAKEISKIKCKTEDDKSKPTYIQMFLDMYMKIKKPLKKDEKKEIAPKERNAVRTQKMVCESKKNIRTKKNFNETANFSKSMLSHQNQTTLSKAMIPDIDKHMENIVEKVAESNDNFRFISENLDIMKKSSDDECDTAIDKIYSRSSGNQDIEDLCKNKCVEEIGENDTVIKMNSHHKESCIEDNPFHCDSTLNNIDYSEKKFMETSNSLLISFKRSLSFEKKGACSDDDNGVARYSSLEKLSYSHSNNEKQSIDQAESNLEGINDLLNSSSPCFSAQHSGQKSDVVSVYEPGLKTDTYSNAATIETTPGTGKETKTDEPASIDFDHIIKNNPILFSVSQRYNISDTAKQKCPSMENDNNVKQNQSAMKGNIHFRGNLSESKFLSSNKKQKKSIIDIHPAEELEEKMFREEEERKKYLDDFKKPEKKKMSHHVNENNFYLDSTVTNLIPVTGIDEQSKKLKLCDIGNILNAGNERSEYNKKSIKWRSPLVFSPAVKFSPKINGKRTFGENEIHNFAGDETFDTSISSKSPKQTGYLKLNIQRTPKQFKASQHGFKQRGTKFPLCDNDYDGISKSLTSKEFSEICEPSFLEDIRTENEGLTPKEHLQSKTSSATDYYTQFLNQSSAHSERQHDKQGSQKIQSSLNFSFNENQENMPPSVENVPKKINSSQNVFDSGEYNINGRDVQQSKFSGSEDIQMPHNESLPLERGDVSFGIPQDYCDPRFGHNNYEPMTQGTNYFIKPTSDPHFIQPTYAPHSYRPYLHNENLYPPDYMDPVQPSNSSFQTGYCGFKCCQLRPYTYQNEHAHSVNLNQSRHLSSEPENYQYSLRSPKPIYHFNEDYHLKQPLNTHLRNDPRNQHFSQAVVHDQSHRIPPTQIPTSYEGFGGGQEADEIKQSSQRGMVGGDMFNKSFYENNFIGYPEAPSNRFRQRDPNMQGLNDSFMMRNAWFPSNVELYNHHGGYPHNPQNSDHHRNLMNHSGNFSRQYDVPTRSHGHYFSPNDKNYVMNKFLYSLNQ